MRKQRGGESKSYSNRECVGRETVQNAPLLGRENAGAEGGEHAWPAGRECVWLAGRKNAWAVVRKYVRAAARAHAWDHCGRRGENA